MNELIQEILRHPVSSLLIIGNLILVESLLSVDNAAVLATMVMELPVADRRRALKYGIFGAYLFRGLCLVFATYLVKIWWLKALGGLYLVYLALDWLRKKRNKEKTEEHLNKDTNAVYKFVVRRLGTFWATVISVELMDLVFSLDNVFAAVAFSKNIIIILTGVFIGILAMRFVAQGFVKLMHHYPFLEGCAFIVIGILGVKLALSVFVHFYPGAEFSLMLESHVTDWATSIITIGIFFIPMITSKLFNFPKKV